MFWLALIAALLPLSAEPVIVPLKLVHQIPVVNVYLNGTGPYRMIVDTGASLSLLDQRIARRLSLPLLRRTTMLTIFDETTVPVGKLSALSIGSASFRDVEVMLLAGAQLPRDLIDADWVLGQNVLSRVDYLLDYQHRKIQFDLSEGRVPVGRSVRCGFEKDRCLVAGTVPGRGTRDLVLDSGASLPLIPGELMINVGSRLGEDVQLTTHAGTGSVQSSHIGVIVVDGHILSPGLVLVAPSRSTGILPTHLFRAIYFHNTAGEVIFNPAVR